MICKKCGGTLYRSVTGNVIDYRHAGGEYRCPTNATTKQPHKFSFGEAKDSLEHAAGHYRSDKRAS
jgi:hypothetical protein